VTTAAQAFAGTDALTKNASDIFGGGLATGVLGSPLDKLLIIAVLTSASASTQTTILPTARTTLSMARQRAFPPAFGRIHPRFQTPDFSTLLMGAVSALWFIAIVQISTNVLTDSVTAIGFTIAFYYGITGYACAIYYRHELTKSLRNFVYVGLLPVAGGAMLTFVFYKAFDTYRHAHGGGVSKPILGIGAPVAIGVGSLLVGLLLMLIARFRYREFFARRTEVADPAVLSGGPPPAAMATEGVA